MNKSKSLNENSIKEKIELFFYDLKCFLELSITLTEQINKIHDKKEFFINLNPENIIIDSKTNKFNELSQKDKEIIIYDIAANKILDQQAKKEKLHKDIKIKKQLEALNARLLRIELLKRKADIQITDEDIINQYKLLVKALKGKDEFRVRHILVKSKKDAYKILKDIREKETGFEKIAAKKSLDLITADQGGDLGYFVPGNKPTKFEITVLKMKKGAISKPVKTELGWHIINLVDRRPAKPQLYDNVKDNIRANLIQNTRAEFIANLLEKHNIKIKQ